MAEKRLKSALQCQKQYIFFETIYFTENNNKKHFFFTFLGLLTGSPFILNPSETASEGVDSSPLDSPRLSSFLFNTLLSDIFNFYVYYILMFFRWLLHGVLFSSNILLRLYYPETQPWWTEDLLRR
jgi:hypothetical protein